MEPEVYMQVKNTVKKFYNIDLNHYKDEQMKRRLDSWLARSRMQNWAEYFHLLSDNSVERDRFRNYLTINVTEFFRDPDRWTALRHDVLPGLLKNLERIPDRRSGTGSFGTVGPGETGSSGGLRVWSAGCSIGVEAYTLSILLEEESPHRPHYLLATDFDRGALQKASARGPYIAEEIRNLNPDQRARYLIQQKNQYFIKETISKRVTFREQDMLNDKFENGFDLIVCRNVVIYFTSEAKTTLYHKFQAALRPGGVLFMGGTEIIPRPTDIGLRNYGISFYMKV
ncbi:MAG: protein-glutamate O-methyltransferase CheR [Anaerolineaceae bacterium]|nr:protein-glutamate O-methyltransferase CheR [Anaerolineaceae bacterium]